MNIIPRKPYNKRVSDGHFAAATGGGALIGRDGLSTRGVARGQRIVKFDGLSEWHRLGIASVVLLPGGQGGHGAKVCLRGGEARCDTALPLRVVVDRRDGCRGAYTGVQPWVSGPCIGSGAGSLPQDAALRLALGPASRTLHVFNGLGLAGRSRGEWGSGPGWSVGQGCLQLAFVLEGSTHASHGLHHHLLVALVHWRLRPHGVRDAVARVRPATHGMIVVLRLLVIFQQVAFRTAVGAWKVSSFSLGTNYCNPSGCVGKKAPVCSKDWLNRRCSHT